MARAIALDGLPPYAPAEPYRPQLSQVQVEALAAAAFPWDDVIEIHAVKSRSPGLDVTAFGDHEPKFLAPGPIKTYLRVRAYLKGACSPAIGTVLDVDRTYAGVRYAGRLVIAGMTFRCYSSLVEVEMDARGLSGFLVEKA